MTGHPRRVEVRPLPCPSPPPGLDGDAVQVWEANPDRPPVPAADLLVVLSAAERERHARMQHRPTADRFAHARGLLRHLLASHLGCRPAAVPLAVTPDGKPEVPGGPHFNLSHTAGRLLVAVAAVPVGVDVEPVRTVPSADDLVRRWFHPAEQAQYFGLPTEVRPAAFLRGWTSKEALLKGVGCGARELAGCVVDLDPDAPPAVRLSPDGRGWQLVDVGSPGFAGVVAVRTDHGVSPKR